MTDTTANVSEPVPVGALHCQKHPFDRTLTTTIVSATSHPTDPGLVLVTTVDTVLFPEGGGQPADRGTLTLLNHSAAGVDPQQLQVIDVQRTGTTTVHTVRTNGARTNPDTAAAFEPGTPVQLDVDWPRRWDAMQQHSGQHLLSAVAERAFGWRTASWAFGSRESGGWSSVEFAPDMCPASVPVTLERIQQLEDKVAEYIEQALAITVTTDSGSDADTAVPATRTSAKSLPHDLAAHAVPIRTVHIHTHDKPHTVDANPCCGTHLTSTSQLGTVLLRPAIERVRGTNSRVYFTFGSSRARALAGESLAREIQLGTILSSGPREFADKATKLLDTGKADRKRIKALVEALAAELVQAKLVTAQQTRYHADEAASAAVDMDVLLAMGSALKQQGVTSVFTLSAVFDDTLGVVLAGPVGNEMNDRIAQVTGAVVGMRGGGGKGKAGSIAIWQGRLSPVTKEAVDKVKAL